MDSKDSKSKSKPKLLDKIQSLFTKRSKNKSKQGKAHHGKGGQTMSGNGTPTSKLPSGAGKSEGKESAQSISPRSSIKIKLTGTSKVSGSKVANVRSRQQSAGNTGAKSKVFKVAKSRSKSQTSGNSLSVICL